jgi:glutamine synthetase
VLARAQAQGYLFNVGIEPEFFLVKKEPDGSIKGWDPHGVDDLAKPCYDFKGISGALCFLRELNDGLVRLGWGVYQSDHEDANFQYEVNFRYADALVTADRLIFFRMMAGQLAQRAGAVATFMAKPFSSRTGSGAHIHYHLADASSGTNLFLDEADRRSLGLSALAYHFMGGVLDHAPALCAVTSPTVNCYKRLQMGSALTGSRSGYTWTPAFISYGDNNRTQMLRVPEAGHIEDRSISSAFNPYLGIAAYLAAGLDGIARGLDPGEPNLGNLYTSDLETMARRGVHALPQSLPEALVHFERDSVVRESLGPIADELCRLKRDEWREYHAQVEAWELGRYLNAL